jgi:hypothetical protein
MDDERLLRFPRLEWLFSVSVGNAAKCCKPCGWSSTCEPRSRQQESRVITLQLIVPTLVTRYTYGRPVATLLCVVVDSFKISLHQSPCNRAQHSELNQTETEYKGHRILQ